MNRILKDVGLSEPHLLHRRQTGTWLNEVPDIRLVPIAIVLYYDFRKRTKSCNVER